MVDQGLSPTHIPALRKVGLGPLDAAAGTHGFRGGTWKIAYSDANAVVQEIALGADGTVLTSTGASAAPAFEVPTVYTAKYTTTDRTKANNTLAADTDLTVSVAANTNYLFTFGLMFTCAAATPDAKVAFSCPAAQTLLSWGAHGPDVNVIAAAATTIEAEYVAADGSGGGTAIAYGISAAGLSFVWGSGILRNGANAGSLAMNWAQNVTDAVNVLTLKHGSQFIVYPA